jgi:cob(I)alamin adenosyltransferase
MKIYTKTGDAGATGLLGARRVSKDDVRIEAYGTVDELNAAIGLVRTEPLPPQVEQTLTRVQSELFVVGAELATLDPQKHGLARIGDREISLLEVDIDLLEAGLPALRNFVLPGGCRAGALIHMARGICRRSERRVVTLAKSSEAGISGDVLRYLNRLSDYLFVAARFSNYEAKAPECKWEPLGG